MAKVLYGTKARISFDGGKTWTDLKPATKISYNNWEDNNMNYEDEAKKRRTCPVFSNTYDNGGWSERDSLPTGDPIGDVDEPKKQELDKACAEMHEKFVQDQKEYDKMMSSRLVNPNGKFTYNGKAIEEVAQAGITFDKKCNCGTEAVYGKVPLDAHRHYCDLRN